MERIIFLLNSYTKANKQSNGIRMRCIILVIHVFEITLVVMHDKFIAKIVQANLFTNEKNLVIFLFFI